MNRRRFLAGTVSAATLLAGCAGSDDSEPTTTDDSGPGSTPDPTTTPGDPTTEPPTTTPGDPTTEPPTTTPGDPTTEPPTTTPGMPSPSTGIVNGSFENDLDGWTIDRDLPEDPNNAGEPVDSSVEGTTARAADGESALQIGIDGSADDGTVWVQQEADLSEASTLKVDGYSDQNSFNTVLQVSTYTGPVPEDGLGEKDFDREHSLWDHEGWKSYEYEIDHDGPGLVAVGLNIVWETGAAGILDNVRLE